MLFAGRGWGGTIPDPNRSCLNPSALITVAFAEGLGHLLAFEFFVGAAQPDGQPAHVPDKTMDVPDKGPHYFHQVDSEAFCSCQGKMV